ncbi:Radical SAM domain protein [Elusimicrobium minutum Pei191]|uniref:Radical SAM domain protein n=1 Tax=Elusimicrobium minutum (strain Pei191) TaxID=445932 RepID=B2KDB9_ELUMP|nr:radical SAM protein [Elusimicrobium minutum]ACC98515.1 Radical SAM domain protein [Elusimicrobium minutum Pei191]
MKKKTGTKEWSSHSVNSQIGCIHGCIYCYATRIAKRFKLHPTGKYTEEYTKEPKICRYKGVIMYPTTHDIHEKNYRHCFKIIQDLLDRGNRVLVVSKMSLRVAREFTRHIKSDELIEVRITITSQVEATSAHFEPNAPSYESRLRALEHLHRCGFKTSVSIEPFLTEPGLIVKAVEPFCTGDIWVGCLNGFKLDYKNEPEQRLTWLLYKRLSYIYNRLKDNPKIKFKESFMRRIK